jgi:hypothetical protein
MDTPIIDKIVEQLEALPDELQQSVLEFTRSLTLSKPRGVPGGRLLRFAGAISPDEAHQMSEAIEQGCEQVDPNEW